MTNIDTKNIVIGITGCIAVYKIAELTRLFIKKGFNIDIIMTESATKFVTPLTFSTLTRNKVYTSMFDTPDEYNINHISLADKADVFLIAPATANIIAKIVNGLADDLLSTTVMATKAPVILSPAMNVNMWNNPIVQENIIKLKQKGYYFIDPASGDLACGYEGAGRMQDINILYNEVCTILNTDKPLKGKKILLAMGPTREYIDPVRYISNKSSGKMGIAILEEAIRMGANVTAVSSVDVSQYTCKYIKVETASQMLEALQKSFPDNDILIMVAAVSDYTPKLYCDRKIKKEEKPQEISLDLVKNPDIISQITANKRINQKVIGFAAETDNLILNAKEKIKNKNLDLIVANDVSRDDIGMGSNFNEVYYIYPDGKLEQLTRTTKNNVASRLLEIITTLT